MLKSKSLTSGFTDDIIGGNDVTSGFLFFLWWFLLGFFVFTVVDVVVVDVDIEVELAVEVVVEVVFEVEVVEVELVEAVEAMVLFFEFFDLGDFVLWQFLWCPSSFIHFLRFGWSPLWTSSDLKSSLSSWFSSIISSFNSSSRNRKVTIGYPIFNENFDYCFRKYLNRPWKSLKIAESVT